MNSFIKHSARHWVIFPFAFALTFIVSGFQLTAQQAPHSGHYYQIVAKHSGKVLDVKGGTEMIDNGVHIMQWESHGGDNQLFRLEEVGDGFYQIIAKHSGKALDITGGERKVCNGIGLQQWEINGQDNQLFRLVNKGNGYYTIVAKHSGKALDVTGGTCQKGNGVKIQQWECNGQDNQLFQFVEAGDVQNHQAAQPRQPTGIEY